MIAMFRLIEQLQDQQKQLEARLSPQLQTTPVRRSQSAVDVKHKPGNHKYSFMISDYVNSSILVK